MRQMILMQWRQRKISLDNRTGQQETAALIKERPRKEIWKDIPDYEGKYQASSLGRIKSLKRKVRGENPYTHKEFFRTVPERILRPGTYCKGGHVSVVLGHGENGKPVHQLVALTFLGPRPKGFDKLHINGNPKDNRVENLMYGTRTENILDVYLQEKAWRCLTIYDVVKIRKLLELGMRGVDIAHEMGISQSCVSGVKCGRTFSWLPKNVEF